MSGSHYSFLNEHHPKEFILAMEFADEAFQVRNQSMAAAMSHAVTKRLLRAAPLSLFMDFAKRGPNPPCARGSET